MYSYEERFPKVSETFPLPPELPRNYDEDVLVFMVRDPYWVFAYWDTKAATKNSIKSRLGEKVFAESRLLIKIFKADKKEDLDQSSHLHMELDVSGPAQSWYIHLGQPDRAFYGILGYLTGSGEFIEIARSNPIVLPRDTISSRFDEKWMAAEETYQKMLQIRREEGGSPMEWGELKKELHRRLFEVPGSFFKPTPPRPAGDS